jgi:hypothetical protein
MKFKLFREHGALNSPPIFDAFEAGIKNLGYQTTQLEDGIPVIWSALWQGRMRPNQKVFETYRKRNIPVIFIEVGNLIRGKTWRISLNHINGQGCFGNNKNLNPDRPDHIGINLKPIKNKRKDEILIACQHQYSLQWQGQPPMQTWVHEKIKELQKFTDRKIIVRPHPRFPIAKLPGIVIEIPKKVIDTYDSFDIDYNYYCVVNHNSGPAVQAAIDGVPVICDKSSLAAEVGGSIENIENIRLPNREEWFLKICHTEWTIEEMAAGIPLNRLPLTF